MAIVLKTGKSYTDKYGMTKNTNYMVIDLLKGFNKKNPSSSTIYASMYASKKARTDGEKPLDEPSFSIKNELFEQYFGISVLDGSNVWKQAYIYLLNEIKVPKLDIKGLQIPIMDGENQIGVELEAEWKDWKSDEK